LPRQLTYRGSRLVYSRGIAALAIVASLLIILFQASVSRLIPLYAIGVFLSFTISQSGMARRWWKSGKLEPGAEVQERGSTLKYDSGWKHKMFINGFGAIITFVVMIIFTITKFMDGAYIVVILIPALVMGFSAIHKHYNTLAKDLSLEDYLPPGRIVHQRVLLLVSGVHKGTLAALRYAKTLSDDVTAVHVSIDPLETRRVQDKWEMWGEGYRLVVIESPFRLFIEPLLEYIEEIDENRSSNEIISIVVPQFIPRRGLTNLLHSRTADLLRKVLLSRKDIVVMEVPYLVD